MPRPIVLGNGSLLLGLDSRGAIRDLFWPQVGRYNHLSGHKIRMGVWAAGRFSWTDEDAWQRTQVYRPGSLIADSNLSHPEMGIALSIEEAAWPDRPVYVRRIGVRTAATGPQEVRLFFTHDLRLDESDIGDTAFYNPFLDALIHYKASTWLLFGGSTHLGGLFEYSTGIKAFGGFEGTWRDAEDGQLSMNAIAQGSVDSTMSLRLDLKPGTESHAWYWIAAGRNLDDVRDQVVALTDQGPRMPDIASTLATDEWEPHIDRSARIITTHCDAQGGVIAATDSDIMVTNRANYCYVWPRDGAFVSQVLSRLGRREVCRRFFEFCARVMPHERPVFFQKYGPDGTMGASWHPWIVEGKPEIPSQQDETALVLVSLAQFIEGEPASEVERWVDQLVWPIAGYLIDHRDPVTGLPLPSWDLWEERRGIHAFTVATVIAGLRAAARVLDDRRGNRCREVADEMASGLASKLFDDARGVYFRRLSLGKRGQWEPDPVLDSSVLMVGLLGAASPDDPRVAATAKAISEGLSVRSAVGGIARYDGDYYFRCSEAYPGNPWLICTLWLAQTQILLAQKVSDLDEPKTWLDWAIRWSAPTGVMAEQLNPDTGEPISVSPLTWSHAEFIKTALDYREVESRLRA